MPSVEPQSFLLGLTIGLAVAVGTWLALRATKARKALELSGALSQMTATAQQHIAALTAERNQATAILESMAEGVIALDANGRILLANPAAEALLGLSAREAAGRSLLEAVRAPDVQEFVRLALQERTRLARDLKLFQPQEQSLRIHAVPCAERASPGPSLILVVQDISKESRYEQLRREFVANVSHELKSPLTSIRGLTETLLGGALEDPASNRRFVQLIDEDTVRLARLIDDLLALSQIESQAVPLKIQPVSLRPLVDAVVESLRPQIQQSRLTVALELSNDFKVRADPDRLRQVMANLLDNAVKYNQAGGAITVSAARQDGWATISVSDTGIGIPERDLPRIFERFYRVDKARSRELGGTGLGLSIVKHIVEAHGGAVSVDSRASHGSTFSFTLPLVA